MHNSLVSSFFRFSASTIILIRKCALSIVLIGMMFSCAEEKRPNIIFLLTDDQRYDALGAMGNDIMQTPSLDKLADEGVLFTNGFVTTSICCTSRASIFSGQYARRHGINDFVTSFSDASWEQSYPSLLKKNGYFTGFVGKFGVGEEEDMPKSTFDFWRGFGGWGFYETTDDDGSPIHLTRKIGNQINEFLDVAGSNDAPFCLSVSFKAPHCQDGDERQFIVDSSYANILAGVQIPEEPLNMDEYYNLFSEKFRERNEARHRWNVRFSTPQKYQTMVSNYYRLIYGVDEVVRKMRDDLKKKGLADNTVIIFTSDNGFYLGEYGLAGKWYGHEESIRVPMIIFDPRTNGPNAPNKEMVLNIDIAPTILELAGIPVPDDMQGKSMVGLLQGNEGVFREEFFYEHQFIRATWGHQPYIPGVEGVVRENVKYMRYLHGGDTIVYEELFDKKIADNELENLIESSDYQDLRSELQERTDFLKKELN